jgi:hypothetical protein
LAQETAELVRLTERFEIGVIATAAPRKVQPMRRAAKPASRPTGAVALKVVNRGGPFTARKAAPAKEPQGWEEF